MSFYLQHIEERAFLGSVVHPGAIDIHSPIRETRVRTYNAFGVTPCSRNIRVLIEKKR